MVYSWVEQKRRKQMPREKEDVLVGMGSLAMPSTAEHNTTPKVRIGVIDAMNGRILEVATATPIPGHNHYDWKMEMYVVPEGQMLSEAIAVVMLMKGLEK
jgi:oxalate decarboxylase/phosphoglucose isomerase-like protein (cupin superfamily)